MVRDLVERRDSLLAIIDVVCQYVCFDCRENIEIRRLNEHVVYAMLSHLLSAAPIITKLFKVAFGDLTYVQIMTIRQNTCFSIAYMRNRSA